MLYFIRKVCLTYSCSKEEARFLTNRIAELRKVRRVTQEELADAVGVTRQTIISLENGRYNASLLLAHRLSRYFGLTIEELFIFEEDN
jgi:putative transcriptional regulator